MWYYLGKHLKKLWVKNKINEEMFPFSVLKNSKCFANVIMVHQIPTHTFKIKMMNTWATNLRYNIKNHF